MPTTDVAHVAGGTPAVIEVDRKLLVSLAWLEYHAAHAEYKAEQISLREQGYSKRWSSKHAQGPRWRLYRAWMWLVELGEASFSETR